MMSDSWDGISADVFLNILLRIPPSPRRRLRLVCQHWRDVIDEHTPEPRACTRATKVLAFLHDHEMGRSHAFVFDELKEGRSRELDLQHSGVDSSSSDAFSGSVRLIGTCNGLLCLRRKRGDIAVTNPTIVGETIAVEPPLTWHAGYASTYSFGYHPATGQYKIVHVPCDEQQGSELDAVHVFTLGDGSWQWREVPAPPGSSCLLSFGLVSIHGVTYWATIDGERVMSFDLKDDRVALAESLPLVPVPHVVESFHRTCHLTDVSGRLGLVVCYDLPDELNRFKTQVWVLDDGGGHAARAWVKRCTVLFHGRYGPYYPPFHRQEIALPHVAHGEHVLTIGYLKSRSDSDKQALEAHPPPVERKMRPWGEILHIGPPRPETTVGAYDGFRSLRTFAYVETREPLLVYGDNNTQREN